MYMYMCMHTMQIQSSRAKHNSVTIPPKIKLAHFKLMIICIACESNGGFYIKNNNPLYSPLSH